MIKYPMTSTKWTAELIPEMLSRQIIIGKKKNFAIEASMKPLKRSKVKLLVRCTASLGTEVNIRMIVKKQRFAGIQKFEIKCELLNQ